MPLTNKGQKIMSAMTSEYGEKKGKQVFYASRNAGKIKGVDPESVVSKRKKNNSINRANYKYGK